MHGAILHTFGIGKESAFPPFHTLCILFVQLVLLMLYGRQVELYGLSLKSG